LRRGLMPAMQFLRWAALGLILAAAALSARAEEPAQRIELATRALVAKGLSEAEISGFLARAGEAGYSAGDKAAMLEAVVCDEPVPLAFLLTKCFEAVSKRIPASRAVPAIESLRGRLASMRRVLEKALGAPPPDDLVECAAMSSLMGMSEGDVSRVASAVAAKAKADRRAGLLVEILRLTDEFLARKCRGSDAADAAVEVAARGYSKNEVAALAKLVSDDLASGRFTTVQVALEAFRKHVKETPSADTADASADSGDTGDDSGNSDNSNKGGNGGGSSKSNSGKSSSAPGQTKKTK